MTSSGAYGKAPSNASFLQRSAVLLTMGKPQETQAAYVPVIGRLIQVSQAGGVMEEEIEIDRTDQRS